MRIMKVCAGKYCRFSVLFFGPVISSGLSEKRDSRLTVTWRSIASVSSVISKTITRSGKKYINIITEIFRIVRSAKCLAPPIRRPTRNAGYTMFVRNLPIDVVCCYRKTVSSNSEVRDGGFDIYKRHCV